MLARAGAEAAESDRRRIEDQIERLKDERAGYEGRVDAAQTQMGFIKELMELPSRPFAASAATQMAREDWSQIRSPDRFRHDSRPIGRSRMPRCAFGDHSADRRARERAVGAGAAARGAHQVMVHLLAAAPLKPDRRALSGAERIVGPRSTTPAVEPARRTSRAAHTEHGAPPSRSAPAMPGGTVDLTLSTTPAGGQCCGARPEGGPGRLRARAGPGRRSGGRRA